MAMFKVGDRVRRGEQEGTIKFLYNKGGTVANPTLARILWDGYSAALDSNLAACERIEPKPKHANRDTFNVQNEQEGRLCGDCFKPIAVGEWAVWHLKMRRMYHKGCRAGIPTIGDSLNSYAVQQLATQEASAPRPKQPSRRKR